MDRSDADPEFEARLVTELPALRAFVRLRCGARLRALESSSDLVQSVCREIWKDRGVFEDRGPASFRRWLFLAAARKLADRGRAMARRPPVATPRATDSSTGSDAALLDCYRSALTASAIAARGEGIAAAEAAFDRLPDEHREAILLCRVVGLTQAEAAEQMGRTEEAVRKLVSRGLAKLSILLESGA